MDLTALARATVFVSPQSKAVCVRGSWKSAHNLDQLQTRFSLLLGASFCPPRAHHSSRNGRFWSKDNFDKLRAPKVETAA